LAITLQINETKTRKFSAIWPLSSVKTTHHPKLRTVHAVLTMFASTDSVTQKSCNLRLKIFCAR
jgi:hypothetical protein